MSCGWTRRTTCTASTSGTTARDKDTWGYRIWQRRAEGTIETYIPARKGFRDDFDDFHFVRDATGTMYWVDRGTPCVVRKRSPGGPAVTIARASFRDVRWMTVTPQGTVYLVDLHDLVRVDAAGTVRTMPATSRTIAAASGVPTATR
jgi:hypothetical protein